jgi:predicted RNase H-like HicB family nuclease
MAADFTGGKPSPVQASFKIREGYNCGSSIGGACPEDTQEHSGTGWTEMRYLIIYEKTTTGYSAYAPDLPGCIAAGFSFEETAGLMRRAVELHLESMRADGDPIPEPTTRADYVDASAA